MIAGEIEELGENLPQRHFVPPQIPHDHVRFRTPYRSGGKPATNRLSYGAALNHEVVVGQSPAGKNVSTEGEDIVGIRHKATTGKAAAD
jgi:hypothetical protein